mgnify:CR=1 FL=1
MKLKIIVFMLAILLVLPFSNASMDVKDKIEFCWDNSDSEHFLEHLGRNQINLSESITRGESAIIGTANESIRLPGSVATDIGKFSVAPFVNDDLGWWFVVWNYSGRASPGHRIISISDNTHNSKYSTLYKADSADKFIWNVVGGVGSLNTIELVGGFSTAGLQQVTAIGSTGSKYWGFHNGVNLTINLGSGVNNGQWYKSLTDNGVTLNTGVLGARARIGIDDIFQGNIQLLIYGNGTPTSEQLGNLSNFTSGAASGVNPVNCSTIYEEAVTPPSPIGITINAVDLYDGAAVNNFTVVIFNDTAVITNSTTTGTLTFANLTNGNYSVDIIKINDSGGYFNQSFVSVNVSSDFTVRLFQTILHVNMSEVISGTQILNFDVSAPLQKNTSNSSGFANLFLRAGDYNLSLDAATHLTTSDNVSLQALEERTITFEMGTANITVTATEAIGGSTISQFRASILLLSTGFGQTIETINGTAVFKAIAGTFNVSINASGFNKDFEIITVSTSNNFPNVSFSLFSVNTINITIIDEENNEIINYTPTTIIFTHEYAQFTNITTNGKMFVDTLFDGLWDLIASTPFHDQRHYFFTITPDVHTNLNIYLLNTSNGESKTFNIKNQEDQGIEGVLITISNQINNTFVTVAQKFSDFAGQAVIFLRSDREYRFTVEAEGFTTKVFDLEVLQSTYNIILTSVDIIDFTTIFDKISYTILPESNIVNHSVINFSIITSSPAGFVTYFGLNSSFNITIPRITNVTGSPAGGTASISINLTNQSGASIPIDYFIKLSDEEIILIHRTYFVGVVPGEAGNFSAVSLADKYKDDFSDVMKALLIVLAAVAVIIALSEVGVPGAISGPAGAIVIIGGAIIGWIPISIAFIVGLITIGMFMLRRGDG